MLATFQREDALLDAVAVIRISHADSTPKQVHGMLVQRAEWSGMSISAVKRACCKVAKLGLLSSTAQAASETPYTDSVADPPPELLTLPDALLALVCDSIGAEDAACFKVGDALQPAERTLTLTLTLTLTQTSNLKPKPNPNPNPT